MMLDYFYGQSGELFAYFRIPKALFQDSRFRQLSTDARTLYGILLDRMSLSAKNSWVDEHGRVYIIYTVREVQESLCCAEHKAVKLFRELEQADLIERKRRGLGRPSLIYVKNFSSGLPKAQIQNCANSNSCAAESAPNSPDKNHFMVEVSPYFTKLASSRDTDQLLAMLPYKSLHLSSVKDRFGIYALVDKNENRDKGIHKPRASVRKQLSETKQAASPKKAAARSKQHEMEV